MVLPLPRRSSGRHIALLTCLLTLVALLAAVPAGAATTTYPAERTFSAGLGGWTGSSTRNCFVVAVHLCSVSNSHAAASGNPGGALQTGFDTVAGIGGVLSATASWTSPSFTYTGDTPNSAQLSIDRFADVDALLTLLSGSGSYSVTLHDVTAASDTPIIGAALTDDSSWATLGGPVTPSALVNGHQYQVVIGLSFAINGVTVLSSSSVRWDNVVLTTTVDAPTATTQAADDITQSTATLHATVNPNGHATTVSFEYGPTAAYGTTITSQSAGSGSAPVAREQAISGLPSNGAVHFRVVTTSSGGTTYGSDQTFTTLVDAPSSDAGDPPAVSGTGRVGQTLTCAAGTWTGSPALTYSWLRDGGVIGGETGTTYLLGDGDEGSAIACRVTGTNAGGSTDATSTATTAVLPVAPANLSLPRVTGTPRAGATVTCDLGTWERASSTAVEWLRDGAPTGSVAPSHAITASEVGATLACRVAASNAGGTTMADSASVTVAAAAGGATTGGSTDPVIRTITDDQYDQFVTRYSTTLEVGTGPGGSIIPAAECTILGTAGADTLVGTAGRDVICGFGGDDTIQGMGGDDVIDTASGADVVDGGAGNDLVFGLAGRDRLSGGAGSDRMAGGRDADQLAGGVGNDFLTGSSGNDVVEGGAGSDQLIGWRGNDRVTGGAGADRIMAGAGNDQLAGGAGDDSLDGGAGNDQLRGEGGLDLLSDRIGRNRHDAGSDREVDRVIAGLRDVVVSRGRDVVRRR